jgi:hypothetical protein
MSGVLPDFIRFGRAVGGDLCQAERCEAGQRPGRLRRRHERLRPGGVEMPGLAEKTMIQTPKEQIR